MEKVKENTIMLAAVTFLVLLFFVGGLMTRNMDITNSISETKSVNM